MNPGRQYQLSTVLEQNKLPGLPEDIATYLTKPQDPESVKAFAKNLHAYHFYEVSQEMDEDQAEAAHKNAEARARISAEALGRALVTLQQHVGLIEQTQAYMMYQAAASGIFSSDMQKPNTFEEWLILKISDEDMSKANKSYLVFFYAHLLPKLIKTDSIQEIEELFTHRNKWRRLCMSIRSLRQVTSHLDEVEKGFEQEQKDYEAKQTVLAKQIEVAEDPTEKKQLEQKLEELEETIEEWEVERDETLKEERKKVTKVTSAAIKVVNNPNIASEPKAIQEAIVNELKKAKKESGEEIPEGAEEEIDPVEHIGQVARFNDMEVWIAVLPRHASMLMETATRGVIDWSSGDIYQMMEMLSKIAPKAAKQLAEKILKGE